MQLRFQRPVCIVRENRRAKFPRHFNSIYSLWRVFLSRRKPLHLCERYLHGPSMPFPYFYSMPCHSQHRKTLRRRQREVIKTPPVCNPSFIGNPCGILPLRQLTARQRMPVILQKHKLFFSDLCSLFHSKILTRHPMPSPLNRMPLLVIIIRRQMPPQIILPPNKSLPA